MQLCPFPMPDFAQLTTLMQHCPLLMLQIAQLASKLADQGSDLTELQQRAEVAEDKLHRDAETLQVGRVSAASAQAWDMHCDLQHGECPKLLRCL